jgi:hypothetical protein
VRTLHPTSTLFGACALALAACGGSTSTAVTIESLVPADGEVTGWTEDPAAGAPGVEVAKNNTEVEAKIDGDAQPFIDKAFVAWARQNYIKDGFKLELRVWQMKDDATATSLYDDLVASYSLYKTQTWSNLSIGDAGRVADTGTTWWYNSRKKLYHVEVRVTQKSAMDATARTEGQSFITAVVAKIK